jgi:hypothetical protein
MTPITSAALLHANNDEPWLMGGYVIVASLISTEDFNFVKPSAPESLPDKPSVSRSLRSFLSLGEAACEHLRPTRVERSFPYLRFRKLQQ